MKWTITLDCHEDGKIDVWKQEKPEKGSLSAAERQRMNETFSAVKEIAREKNYEIIHKPPEESAA